MIAGDKQSKLFCDLLKYQPSAAASNLDRVRGLLEAFYHLCELQAWSQSRTILVTLINVSEPEKLHNQLRNWGYYHEQYELYQKLLGKLDRSFDAFLLNNLGITCTALCKQDRAIDYYQQDLAIAKEIEDRYGESICLGNLGSLYLTLGDYQQAIKYQQQRIIIARSLGDLNGEASSLSSIGNAYYSLGDYTQAIENQQQSLAIAKNIGDRKVEGTALCSLGITYKALGEHEKAIDYYQQSLTAVFK